MRRLILLYIIKIIKRRLIMSQKYELAGHSRDIEKFFKNGKIR